MQEENLKSYRNSIKTSDKFIALDESFMKDTKLLYDLSNVSNESEKREKIQNKKVIIESTKTEQYEEQLVKKTFKKIQEMIIRKNFKTPRDLIDKAKDCLFEVHEQRNKYYLMLKDLANAKRQTFSKILKMISEG